MTATLLVHASLFVSSGPNNMRELDTRSVKGGRGKGRRDIPTGGGKDRKSCRQGESRQNYRIY